MENFPVTESTLSAAHLITFLEKKYQMTGTTTCSLLRTGMNHLYRVTDGDRKFVLRIYTYNWRTKEEIAEELRLLEHLHKNNIRVSFPIADRDDKFIQEVNAPEGIRYAVLFSWADGRKIPRFTAQDSYNIGHLMANLHKVTENLKLNRIDYTAKTLLHDSLKSTRTFFTNPSEEISFVESATEYLTTKYASIDREKFRHGTIHLDIWFDNMHFDDNNSVTIFDFDFCGNGLLCHDVAYFLLQLYNTNQGENEYQLKAQRFLEGYESITKLSEEEKRFIPFAGVSVWLFYLGIQCNRFDNWSNIFLNEDHLKRFIGTIKGWIAFNKIELS